MSKVQPRDISPLLQKVREFLLGRKHTPALRFEEFVASRSPPPPVLPEGPCHKLADNYYFTRDVRREVKPPAIIASSRIALEGGRAAIEGSETKKLPTPGKIHHWD